MILRDQKSDEISLNLRIGYYIYGVIKAKVHKNDEDAFGQIM
jgi:hypothetical protein